MATGNTQQIINYGTSPNDGTGDPLRTAFIKTDENFDNVWLAGPVGSNIRISNNTIENIYTNGNITIKPNGVGVIEMRNSVLPNANTTYDLGSSGLRWRSAYVGTGGLYVAGDATVTGNLTAGNLKYTGQVFVGDLQGSVFADDSTLIVDAVDNAIYADTISASGNITGSYFIGNGSLLTGIATSTYGNANVAEYLPTYTGNFSANVITATTLSINTITSDDSTFVTVSHDLDVDGSIVCTEEIQTVDLSATGNINGNLVAPGGDGQILYNRSGLIGASPTNFNFDESSQTMFVKTGTFTGDSKGENSIYAGFPSFTVLGSDVVAQFSGNANQYTQFNFQNASAGNTASGDYVITADNGTDDTHFLNIGLAGSGWDGTQENSLGNLLGANDGYFYVQDGNLVIGTKEDGDTHIHTWKWDTTGNVTATGNLIPSANLTYSLGNSTNWWSNIWVASNTIYIGGVALGVTGNTLTVAGEAVLSNDSSSSITTTGNITAGNIISDGEIISNGRAYVRYLDIRGSEASGTIGTLGYNGNIPELYGTAGIRIVTDDTEGGPTWQFGTDGTLTAPGDITVVGDITGTAGANTLVLKAQPTTNTYIQLNNTVDSEIRTAANLEIRTDVSNTAQVWSFDTNGVLTTPGDIDIGGRLTSTTGQLNLEAADNPNAYIQLNDTGDSLFGAAGNLSLLTDGDSQEWIFRTDGTLSLPGATAFMDASANFVGIYADASQNNGIEVYTDADTNIFNTGNVNIYANVAGSPVKTWTFDNTGDFTAPGAISATGNITGGNIDTDGQITVDALSITNSSIAAATQFTISTSNTATGNSSSILMDRNGVGVVVQLEDTGGGPYFWGLYQDNILFPDGSRQYSAYGNANVVANLAALGSNPISTTGNITAGNINANVAGYSIGYREIPQVALSANANVALSDSGKHFYSTTAGNLAILIPTNANVAFPTGTAFTIVVQAAGNVLVNADSGVTLYMAGNSTSGNRVVSTYGMATVMKVASDTWFINGTGVA